MITHTICTIVGYQMNMHSWSWVDVLCMYQWIDTSIVTAVLQYFTCLDVSDTQSVIQVTPFTHHTHHGHAYTPSHALSVTLLVWDNCLIDIADEHRRIQLYRVRVMNINQLIRSCGIAVTSFLPKQSHVYNPCAVYGNRIICVLFVVVSPLVMLAALIYNHYRYTPGIILAHWFIGSIIHWYVIHVMIWYGHG